MSLYRDEGVVLRTWKLGEADRIVSLLTRDHGKVRAVAKGARKPSSRLGARLEPTSHVVVQLYRGRGELDTVTQVETRERHGSLRRDLDRWARASAMLEATEQVAQDRLPNEALLELLVRALRTLASSDSSLVVAGFFLKLLALEGLQPTLDACVSCGRPGPFPGFSVSEGGVTCSSCRRGPALAPGTLELLQAMLGGRLATALRAPAGPDTHGAAQVATELLEHHLERRLRSIAVLGRV